MCVTQSARKKKSGVINFQRPDKKVMTKWKSYRFEVNANYFLYCKTENVSSGNRDEMLNAIKGLDA